MDEIFASRRFGRSQRRKNRDGNFDSFFHVTRCALAEEIHVFSTSYRENQRERRWCVLTMILACRTHNYQKGGFFRHDAR
jgi:hypothetical protein